MNLPGNLPVLETWVWSIHNCQNLTGFNKKITIKIKIKIKVSWVPLLIANPPLVKGGSLENTSTVPLKTILNF